MSPRPPKIPPRASRRITIGYVPLTDCAPLVAAQELGLFAKRGLEVKLSREAGWASVREKILHGELEAANAPASMVFELGYGLGVAPVPCLTGLITAHHGNAIVLSRELVALGATDGPSLRRVITEWAGRRRFTFAGVLKFSSQNYLMRKWLRLHGIDPDREADMVIVPPPLLPDCLAQGHLDGFCVAEPWGSVALARGLGEGVVLSADLDFHHPEKVFLVRTDFERDRAEEHLLLLSALIEAGQWCDHAPNRAGLATLLADPRYVGVSREVLSNALIGPYRFGGQRQANGREQAILFHGGGLDRPSAEKANWVVGEIRIHRLQPALPAIGETEIRSLFRCDLYDCACPLERAVPHPRPKRRRAHST